MDSHFYLRDTAGDQEMTQQLKHLLSKDVGGLEP